MRFVNILFFEFSKLNLFYELLNKFIIPIS